MSVLQTKMPLGLRLFIAVMVSMGAMWLWNSYSPYGSEARLAAVRSRLGDKCVENAAGSKGVVKSVERNGDVVVLLESGGTVNYPETDLTAASCPGA
ncbi:hypothetical protein [Rhizobium tubonense]|uniref:Uncharacterized protein n=1 Tax=Rhizobium tubonense TaxID=484088 RepID=A0A2W4DTS7_9HYPH|nr:hypothetical protein [Rhizobium tubonense]PZM07566.1 hypothetical protein CPY51_31030 [Rhizobium tubonense]